MTTETSPSTSASPAELTPLPMAPVTGAARSGRRIRWSTVIGSGALVLTLLLIVVPPMLSSYDVYGQDLANALMPPFHSATHPLGTDELGRDTLSRLSNAGLTSIRIAVPALAIAMTLGVVLGLIAGYFGKASNGIIMGLADLQLSIPLMILLIMIVTVIRPSVGTLTIVLGTVYWVGYARVARVHALSLIGREFVLASRTFGSSSFWIIRKHLLPKLVPQLAIMGSFDLGVIVVLEAGLSYLGLGIQPPRPSWGGMILSAQDYLQNDVWLSLWPAAAIFLLVGGVQILSRRFTGEREVDPDLASSGRA